MYSLALIIAILFFTFWMYTVSLLVILCIVMCFLRQLSLANRTPPPTNTTNQTTNGWGETNNGWGPWPGNDDTTVAADDDNSSDHANDEPIDPRQQTWFRQMVNTMARTLNEAVRVEDFVLPFPFEEDPFSN